jgi:hypothetical protein
MARSLAPVASRRSASYCSGRQNQRRSSSEPEKSPTSSVQASDSCRRSSPSLPLANVRVYSSTPPDPRPYSRHSFCFASNCLPKMGHQLLFSLSSAGLMLGQTLVVLQPPAVVSFFAGRRSEAAVDVAVSILLFQMPICSGFLSSVYSCVQHFEARVSVLLKWFVLFNINEHSLMASLRSAYLCC